MERAWCKWSDDAYGGGKSDRYVGLYGGGTESTERMCGDSDGTGFGQYECTGGSKYKSGECDTGVSFADGGTDGDGFGDGEQLQLAGAFGREYIERHIESDGTGNVGERGGV